MSTLSFQVLLLLLALLVGESKPCKYNVLCWLKVFSSSANTDLYARWFTCRNGSEYCETPYMYKFKVKATIYMPYTHIITPRAHARSGVKQWVLSVSVSVSVSVCQCVSVSSKFWTDHDNEGSIHF